jgi:hypothetical protein
MATRKIPLRSYPDYVLQTDLDGQTYTLRVRWNQRAEWWSLDLATVDGTPIVSGRKLVTCWPLLRRVVHASRPPGELYLLDLQQRGEEPTYDELGARFALFYVEAST